MYRPLSFCMGPTRLHAFAGLEHDLARWPPAFTPFWAGTNSIRDANRALFSSDLGCTLKDTASTCLRKRQQCTQSRLPADQRLSSTAARTRCRTYSPTVGCWRNSWFLRHRPASLVWPSQGFLRSLCIWGRGFTVGGGFQPCPVGGPRHRRGSKRLHCLPCACH